MNFIIFIWFLYGSYIINAYVFNRKKRGIEDLLKEKKGKLQVGAENTEKNEKKVRKSERVMAEKNELIYI